MWKKRKQINLNLTLVYKQQIFKIFLLLAFRQQKNHLKFIQF